MGRPAINEIGHQYGRLKVLRRATSEECQYGAGMPAVWICQCECGKIVPVPGRDLRNGRQVSCGCYAKDKATELAKELGKKRKADLVGKRFGSLQVIEESTRPEDIKNLNSIWKCRCDCGAITYVRSNYLLSGHTSSCGCQRFTFNGKGGSQGEQLIASILDKNKIEYEREKIFKDLRQGLYRFDFYIPSLQSVLEYNGEQHYKYTSVFYKNKSDFLKAQERDRRKLAYCLANNIKAYCIPYWEMGNINTIDDIFQDKFLARSKFHNDEVWRLQKSKQ